jgi:S-formylglutathione hydrolase
MKRPDTVSSAAPNGKRGRLAIIFMLGALTAPTAAFSQIPAGRVVSESAHFKSLEGNLLKDAAERSFAVYLPFSYQEGRKRYPVIYLLHGGNHSYPAWIDDPHYATVPKIMDKLIASGSVREMIIVMPDGSNAFGNSMWTNSVTTGNWEDYIALDLVDYIDKKYRTYARPASRGIAGHSSGGYGAIKLAMKHPQVFGAVYALSACCLGWDKGWSATSPAWEKALAMRTMDDFTAMAKLVAAGNPRDPQWLSEFLSIADIAVAAAFSPNPARPPFYADFPVEKHEDTFTISEKQQAAWMANLPIPMLGQYRSNLARLHGIAFDIGTQDFNPALLVQAHDLDTALTSNGIPHEFEEFTGTHTDKLAERVENKLLPFFSRVLQ